MAVDYISALNIFICVIGVSMMYKILKILANLMQKKKT